MRVKYSQQGKKRFMDALSLYREALASHDVKAIIAISLQIHRASTLVPQRMRRYVGCVWCDTVRKHVMSND